MDDQALFFEACGACHPLQVTIDYTPRRVRTRRDLDFPFAIVGRNPQNDIVLKHSQVSRRHAYLQIIQGQHFWIDFRSRTGIVREHGPAGTGWSDWQDGVQIGPFVLQSPTMARPPIELSKCSDPMASYQSERDELPSVRLQFLTGVTRDQEPWRVNRVLTLIGSSPQCKLQLIDPSVSRFHGSFLRTPLGVWLIDLLGRGGLCVNGVRVRYARLKPGDEIQIGIVRIGVETDVSVRSSAAASDSSVSGVVAPIREVPGVTAGSDQTLPADPRSDASANLPVSATHPPLSDAAPSASGTWGIEPRPSFAVSGHSSHDAFMQWMVVQFGNMQQSMSLQFQQAVMMMVEMFRSIHEDHMDLVRDEINRLRELNQELLSVQAELARQMTHQNSASPLLPPLATSAGAVPTLPVRQGDPAFASGEIFVNPTTQQTDGTAHETAPRQSALGLPEPGIVEPDQASASPAGVPEPTLQHSSAHSQETEEPSSPGVAGKPLPGEDIHAWLCRRMAAIQSEQHTLWQRILSTVRANFNL